MVKEANTLVPYLVPYKVDPNTLVNESPASSSAITPPKVYEGISRVMVRIPRYEAPALLRFLAACKEAKMPPSRLAQDALANGHGYEVVTQESFRAPFEQQVSEISNYKVYPNAVIAYGLEDADIKLLDSDDLEKDGEELVLSSRALVLQWEVKDKVLDVLIIFFDDQKTLPVSPVNQLANPEQEEALETFIK